MAVPKVGISSAGKPMHYSVGAVIERGDMYVMQERLKEPYGIACVAGHIDEGETKVQALKREVNEESQMELFSYNLVIDEEVEDNKCRRKIDTHHWYVYRCEANGEPKLKPDEAKSIGWYSREQIQKLKEEGALEPVWVRWLDRLGVTK